MDGKTRRKHPKPLADELDCASFRFKDTTPGELARMLEDRLQMIATVGVLGALKAPKTKPTLADLERVLKARARIEQAATPEGAAEYISEPIVRAVMSELSKGQKRSATYDHADIADEARRLGYQQAARSEKKRMLAQIQQRFTDPETGKRPSERTIRTALETYGLVRKRESYAR